MDTEAQKILIVEDEYVFAKNLTIFFQRTGWQARMVPTGAAALTCLEEFLPDWILVDYHLPDMTGVELMETLRAAGHCCGGLLMTGHPTALMLEQTKPSVIGTTLIKPFALAGLRTAFFRAGDTCSTSEANANRHNCSDPCGAAL